MTTENKHQPHPEGAAKLADPAKVHAVETDSSLGGRGAPGQASAPLQKPGEPAAPPDESKLPKDEHGKPRSLTPAEAKSAKERVIEVLKTIYDPEIPVNVYELGLIYEVSVSFRGEVHVKMTLTSPACPVAGTLPGEVEMKLRAVEHVSRAKVELVWSPQWTKDMMSEAAKLELNVS
jgi:FeS assembly SUF system protein